ncbi:hypothetical protein GCM10025772_12900 [Ferrimonas gelatinilytica]|uniref:Uncharacterized protein n=2 Tax=Ferrimonas gelatinilytica TaxID=1255257 RepID=A0ABP9S153_9GAMM
MDPETRKQIEWILMPPLMEVLPHQFENGARFKGFRALCDYCGGEIRLPQVHGGIVSLSHNRCVVNARARCPECAMHCEYHYLLDAEGEMSARRLAGPDDHLAQ